MNYLAIIFNDSTSKTPREWMLGIGVAMSVMLLWVLSLLNVGFSLPLYLLMIVVVSIIVFVIPTTGLPVIILSTMWFERWFTLQPIVWGDNIYKLYPLDVVFLITILGFIFHQAFGHHKRRLKLDRMAGVLLLFFSITLMYLFWAMADGQSDTSLAVSAFKNYAFYGLLYFLALFSIQTFEELKANIKIWFIGGFGVIVFVIIGIIRGQGLWTEYTPLSTEGVRLLAFPHAFYLTLVLIISLVLMLYNLRPFRSTLLVLWIQLFGVLGSLMRHLWIALFMATSVMFVMLPKILKKSLLQFFAKNFAVVVLVGILLVFIVTIFPFSEASMQIQDVTGPLYNRARSLVNSAADSSAQWRIYAWRAARESFMASPIVGIGYGKNLTVDFETYRRVIPIRDIHNSLLVLVVQMGLIGTVVALYFLWLLFKLMRQTFKRKGMLWPYQLAFFSAWLMFLFASIWQPYFETNLTGIFFWILLGMLVVAVRLEENGVHSC